MFTVRTISLHYSHSVGVKNSDYLPQTIGTFGTKGKRYAVALWYLHMGERLEYHQSMTEGVLLDML